MEKFIYTYLSENYYIQTSDVGNYGIYQRYSNLRIPTPFNGDRLIKDVVTIFGVNKNEAKDYIEQWAKLVAPACDLEFYWKMANDFGNIVMPLVQSVAARTIGMDLVPVQPMSAPKGQLLYLDYVYHKESRYEKVKNRIIEIFKNIYNRIFGIFNN